MSEVFQMLNSLRVDFFSRPLRVSGGRSVQVYEPSCPPGPPHPPIRVFAALWFRGEQTFTKHDPFIVSTRSFLRSLQENHPQRFCVLMSVFYLWLKLWSGAGMRPGCCLALCLGVRECGCIVTLKEEMNEVDEGPACHGD